MTKPLLLSLLILSSLSGLRPPSAIRLATFNIENFPKSERQIEGAFKTIEQLNVSAVGVQEIINPERFVTEAKSRLGDAWRFVYPGGRFRLKVGVLYDSKVFQLRSVRTHALSEGRPAFEVRLMRSSGAVLRMVVLHLKAGGDSVEIRRRQYRSLLPIVQRAKDSGEQLVVLGDFNATGGADRAMLDTLTRSTDVVWASKGLACTSYWSRRDGCLATPLDHILTWTPPKNIAARGPCETEGCDRKERCPIFHREVSDHCPVTVELP